MERKKLVLVCDFVENILLDGLESLGYSVVYQPQITMPEVFELAEKLSGIVINTRTPVRANLMQKAVNLKWIARLGSGLDIIDLDSAKEHGIKVLNSPEGNANAVAEHVLGMLLNLLRNISKADCEIRSGKWEREANRGRELSAMKIGIIGFGNTGSAFAKVLNGFGCNVLVYDKYKQHYASDFRFVRELNSMEEVLKESDVVSLHLPLTTETFELVNAGFLSLCKKGSIIVNSSRGKMLVVKDLLNSIQMNHIKGACLDVFPNEKINSLSKGEKEDFEELKKNQCVLLSPHIAGWTFESKIKISEILIDKIKSVSE
ncbi:MAG: phosphoglycerate dehydrogenase [Saprospirales bacterium]|nr:MAG: phosphoglycerate dehydrogenase [Saprospirales bacterium]